MAERKAATRVDLRVSHRKTSGQEVAKLKGSLDPGGREFEEFLAEEATLDTARSDIPFKQKHIKIKFVNGGC